MINEDKIIIEYEEWRLTLTHCVIENDGSKHKLDEPVTVAVVQPLGTVINVTYEVYQRLLYEMEMYLKKND